MPLSQYQRNHFNSGKKDRGLGRRLCEAAVVATLLVGATVATWARPAQPLADTASNSQMQRADIIDDLIEVIDKILGGGSGSGGGSGGQP